MFERIRIAASVAALVILAVIAPRVASAWFLNLANVDIGRAASLPPDSPQRLSALTDAENNANPARYLAENQRLPLAQARILLARGDAARAAGTFDNADTLLRADPIARFVWADAAWQSNQPRAAFEHWRAASAYVYFSQQMHRAVDSHQWKVAEDNARIAVGIDPNSADAHLVLGDALSRQDKNNPAALQELDRARELTRDPELLSTVISRKGEILASQGKLQDALEMFNQARAVAPIDARPRTGYALVLLQIQPDARDQAVALLSQVVTDSPWYTAAYIALASIAETHGDLKGAEEWLQKGLARNPNNPDLLLALGKFCTRQKRFDDARSILTQALKYETRIDMRAAIEQALAELGTQ